MFLDGHLAFLVVFFQLLRRMPSAVLPGEKSLLSTVRQEILVDGILLVVGRILLVEKQDVGWSGDLVIRNTYCACRGLKVGC